METSVAELTWTDQADLDDPHGALRRARHQHWYATNAFGVSVLSHDTVRMLLADPRLEGTGMMFLERFGITDGPIFEFGSNMLFTNEGERHRRLRRLVAKAFTPRAVDSFPRECMPLRVTLRIASLNAWTRTAASNSYAFADPYPAWVLCEFIGLSSNDAERFSALANDLGLFSSARIAEENPTEGALFMSKVWFVTGSSRGLGRAIAEAVLAAGDQVVATARRPEQLVDLFAKYGDMVLPLALDVRDNDAVQAAVRSGYTTFGRYNVVVNNAGYGDVAAVEDVTLEDFRAQIDTNFFGVVNVTKAALPLLRAQGYGHIFQVSSLGGRIGSVGLSAYQSAKWAVGGFSTVLAQEVAPLGIKVTVLEPGGMATDWAGSSMRIPPVSAPYEKTVGEFARMLQEASGAEVTDAVKVAQAIRTLADNDDPPTRILLGADAVEYAAAAARVLADSDEKWRELSLSVSADSMP
jgi:NAD(P)-dependent dehydrogenase (short-subunit alcohol dehydrogenase family)